MLNSNPKSKNKKIKKKRNRNEKRNKNKLSLLFLIPTLSPFQGFSSGKTDFYFCQFSLIFSSIFS